MNNIVNAAQTQFRLAQVKLVENNIDDVIAFVMQSRKKLFPMLDHGTLPADLAQFSHCFIEDDLGCFISLYDHQHLIGVIGFKRYDHRFEQFEFSRTNTVEIVKLFVDERFRRQGLASLLVDYLKAIAISRQIQTLYLHTHPFLGGAKDFWLKHGFTVLEQEQDGVWDTIHMLQHIGDKT